MSITDAKNIPEESLEVTEEFEELLMDWEGYADMEDAEIRTAIVEKMVNMHFGISTAECSEEVIKRCKAPSGRMPYEVAFPAVLDGTTMVYANYDGTSRTGKIEINKPVVYDPTTGLCVTGINEEWSSGEYRIVGIALKDHTETNDPEEPVLIPVKLINPPAGTSSILLCKATTEKAQYAKYGRTVLGSNVMMPKYEFFVCEFTEASPGDLSGITDPEGGIEQFLESLKITQSARKIEVFYPWKRRVRPGNYVVAAKLETGEYIALVEDIG